MITRYNAFCPIYQICPLLVQHHFTPHRTQCSLL